MSSKFEKDVYNKFEQIDARFEQIDARFDKTDARIDNLEKDMKEVKKDISFMKEDMSMMNSRIDNIENVLVSMQKTMESMNRSIILIEHKVTTEIPALFDGYSMHQEKQEIHQENIDSLNVKVEEHDIRISNLEQAII